VHNLKTLITLIEWSIDQNDRVLRECARYLPALAFVPVGDVQAAFDILAHSMVQHDHIDELLSFLKHTYLDAGRHMVLRCFQ